MVVTLVKLFTVHNGGDRHCGGGQRRRQLSSPHLWGSGEERRDCGGGGGHYRVVRRSGRLLAAAKAISMLMTLPVQGWSVCVHRRGRRRLSLLLMLRLVRVALGADGGRGVGRGEVTLRWSDSVKEGGGAACSRGKGERCCRWGRATV